MTNEISQKIVKAYDSMPMRRWDAFAAYCETNDVQTSLLSFIEYLLVCADRIESTHPRHTSTLAPHATHTVEPGIAGMG